ncbi:MAG: YqjF family protein [Angustibacter sp.]
MHVEPITPEPPRSVGRTVFTQTWSRLTFLHWAVDPALVVPHLPLGTRPDLFEGRTYVGLVPFLMRDLGAWGGPPLPYVGSFCETNVRLYSVDDAGRRGVVFVSLDAARLATVLAARQGPGLPYLWSRMRYGSRRLGEDVEHAYACTRRWPGPRGMRSLVRVRVGGEIEAGPLEHFLTARWGLHLTDRHGRTRFWPNDHPRWSLHAAELTHLADELLEAGGFPGLTAREPDSVLHAPGVDVLFGPRLPAARPD